MKKIFAFMMVVCIAGTASVFAKTISKAAPDYVYSGEKPLYPALIYAAFHDNNSHFKNARITTADTDKNIYVFENVVGNDGLKLAKFTLTITLDGNMLRYDYSDLKAKKIRDKGYSSVKRFLLFDKRTISNIFNTTIPLVMGDEALYAKAKEEAEKIIGPQKISGNSSNGSTIGVLDIEYQNTLGKPLYPSMIHAYSEAKQAVASLKYSEIKSCDILNNTMTISKIMSANGMSPQMYNISVGYSEGILHFEAEDLKAFDTSIMMLMDDSELENIPAYDFEKIAKSISDRIAKSNADEKLYAGNKSAFFSNELLLVNSVQTVTEITQEDFLNEIKNTPVEYSLKLSEASMNKVKAYADYKYRLTFLVWHPVGKTIIGHIYYYTNDKDLAKTAKDSKVTINGVLDSYTSGPVTVDFNVVEQK